jgi:hypothetical protein
MGVNVRSAFTVNDRIIRPKLRKENPSHAFLQVPAMRDVNPRTSSSSTEAQSDVLRLRDPWLR